MSSLSRRFKIGVKLHEKPAYRLAMEAGINPNRLYKLMSGICKVKHDDPNVIAVGKILGITPDQCFEESQAGCDAN